ncbi:hypothetical protein B1H29_36900 [Streptomyces pactum]|uniref:Uncharacterized protein n=1 Tax=Streptomyces pactum TaxID=68249 RepID=A0A1S6J1F5_9ACTN|nr:hypothetical protein B1H29_00155 [Streptomyces pactum]AQS71673.1 hypothetical protein B1H29_36900 [Streptomyces pactum]
MRLAGTQAAVRRVWTVELRPRAGGPRLFCIQCKAHTHPVDVSSARSAALTHLASHARAEALPGHLRTCQCRALGCTWHSRSRGCGGLVLLALTRQAGGRSWRLADACAACAAATSETAVVPDTLLGARRPKPAGGILRRAHHGLSPGPDERARVREMLTYLSATLPQFTSPAARLLALQCALRSDTRGHVTVADGLLRSMRLRGRRELWLELAQAGWLETTSPRPGSVAVRLLDATVLDQAPGRGARRRAAHWALHPTPLVLPAAAPAVLRLTALALASHTFRTEDLDAVSRLCGNSPQQTMELLDRLVSARTLAAWHHHQDTDEVLWQFPQQLPRYSADRDS